MYVHLKINYQFLSKTNFIQYFLNFSPTLLQKEFEEFHWAAKFQFVLNTHQGTKRFFLLLLLGLKFSIAPSSQAMDQENVRRGLPLRKYSPA